jgi:hypothetical protein
MLQDTGDTTVPTIVHGISPVKNPEPVTVTPPRSPTGPEDGLRAMDGGRTVNVYEEKSPLG